MDDGLIEVQVIAIRAICGQLTAAQLEGLQRSVQRACRMPKRTGWARKAAAHAEIFSLLADAAHDSVLAQVLKSGASLGHHLMVTAGPAASGMTANSRQRLLACLRADNPAGAAHEMEAHLRVLNFMGRLQAAGLLARSYG
jgi:DNA-binding FadR family transcriptional regulator